MPFTSYDSDAAVARAHRLQMRREGFVTPAPATLGDHFRTELAFTLREVPFSAAEGFVCETLIYPVLREVWKPYSQSLTVWGHVAIRFDDDLCGTPDFIVARRSPFGPFVFDLPYLLVVEAKRDDYLRGWGQCLAAMLACQKLNAIPGQTLYGITTNGRAWEFGKLDGDVFTQDPQPFSLRDLDELTAAINFMLVRCHEQAATTPGLPSAG